MVKYIEINGTRHPIKFSNWALARFMKIQGITFDQLGEMLANMQFMATLELAFCGFENGARIDKKPFPYKIEDIADWTDEKPGIIAEIMTIFGEDMGAIYGNGNENLEDKKKV